MATLLCDHDAIFLGDLAGDFAIGDLTAEDLATGDLGCGDLWATFPYGFPERGELGETRGEDPRDGFFTRVFLVMASVVGCSKLGVLGGEEEGVLLTPR